MHKDGRGGGRAMSVEEMVQGMIDALNAAIGDAGKHDRGNNAAGTRVRKAMQAAKNTARMFASRSRQTRTHVEPSPLLAKTSINDTLMGTSGRQPSPPALSRASCSGPRSGLVTGVSSEDTRLLLPVRDETV